MGYVYTLQSNSGSEYWPENSAFVHNTNIYFAHFLSIPGFPGIGTNALVNATDSRTDVLTKGKECSSMVSVTLESSAESLH